MDIAAAEVTTQVTTEACNFVICIAQQEDEVRDVATQNACYGMLWRQL